MNVITADLYDERGSELQSVVGRFERFGALPSFSGTIRTIRCFEDNGLFRAAVNEPGEGVVLVVDGGASLRTAIMGDQLAARAIENGYAGVIINAAIRDRVVLESLLLGVRALGTNPRTSARSGVGERDVPVTFGEVTFIPGRRVYVDEDGILAER